MGDMQALLGVAAGARVPGQGSDGRQGRRAADRGAMNSWCATGLEACGTSQGVVSPAERGGFTTDTRDYLAILLPFLGYLAERSWRWDAEPHLIREYTRRFLVDSGCVSISVMPMPMMTAVRCRPRRQARHLLARRTAPHLQQLPEFRGRLQLRAAESNNAAHSRWAASTMRPGRGGERTPASSPARVPEYELSSGSGSRSHAMHRTYVEACTRSLE